MRANKAILKEVNVITDTVYGIKFIFTQKKILLQQIFSRKKLSLLVLLYSPTGNKSH